MCQEIKEDNCFSLNKKKSDGLQAQCKVCHSIYRKNHYEKNKQKYIDKAIKYKSSFYKFFALLKDNKQCVDCKVSYPYYVMDYDHKRR